MLVTHIGPYHIGQKISESRGVEEYAEDDYEQFAAAGAPRTFNGEQMYNGENVTFAGISDWQLTIGTIKGIIYKFGLVHTSFAKSITNKEYAKAKAYLMTVGQNPRKNGLLTKNITWHQPEGNIDLNTRAMRIPDDGRQMFAVVANVTSADIMRSFNIIPS